jgi:hemoglobin-like flavoprotein
MGISRHPLSNPPPAWAKVPIDVAAVERLRSSFVVLAADGTRVTAIFYAKLFERYPGVRTLFATDMKAQEGKLMDSLRAVVEHIEAPEAVRAGLRELGAKHVKYGAKPEHYPIVCEILVEAMAEAAGRGWSPQLASEWTQALDIVSGVMLEGAAAGAGGDAHGR